MGGCDLTGKTYVVTGGGRGIGRAICESLGHYGANVVVNDVGASLGGEGTSEQPAEETVKAVIAAGGNAVADGHDITMPEAAQAIVDGAVARFGRIDGVVNNAGILRDGMFHKMSIENWKSVIDVHLMGSFYISNAAAAYFRQQGSGAFVHMTSTSGLIGNLGQANYSAAKLGLVALSKSIALDMARYGVRSNCVAPFAWSRMISSLPTDTPEQKARVERMQKMTPESVAPMVTFLLSDLADDITGQIFGVRANELYLFSPPRLSRSLHSDSGWTPDTIAARAAPTLRQNFCPLDTSPEMFSWDPI
jgi:NAD(P)-dependent dehydrogenase (short-subunit alcohol dehydrogenase family)